MAMRLGLGVPLAVAFAAAGLLIAQKGAISPDTRKEILRYQLSTIRADNIISTLPLMTKFFMAQPQAVLTKWATMTPDGMIASLEKNAQTMAILKSNHLTAKDYVIGVPALRMSVWRAEGVPESAKVFASPANLAFAKANLAQLKPKWEAVDGAPRP